MKGTFLLLRIPVLMLLLLFTFYTSSYAATAGDTLVITESFDGHSIVEFTVDTTYDDIYSFAVGTDYSFDYALATFPDWEGFVTVDHPAFGWSIATIIPDTGGGIPTVEYTPLAGSPLDLGLLSVFDTYDRAFLFLGFEDSFLPVGHSEGFFGLAFAPASVFAAFRYTGDVITGETSMVPIPGAFILLFSGLAALVGIRRKQ